MDFTIYTSGSVEFLEIMLNSTAMITGSGAAEDLARVGALLGIFLLAFQAVFNNQPIGWQKPALLIALYSIFYGPTTTVVIQDTVSSQVRVVDNIPIGPAFVGYTLSSIAHGAAELMEQSTSHPGMTEYGLFSSLYTLSALQDTLANPTSLDAYNNYRASAGVDLPRTVKEHMKYCVGNPSELAENPIEHRYREPNSAAL